MLLLIETVPVDAKAAMADIPVFLLIVLCVMLALFIPKVITPANVVVVAELKLLLSIVDCEIVMPLPFIIAYPLFPFTIELVIDAPSIT